MTPLANRIKEKGYRKGWIAKQAGISPSALTALVSGKSEPSIRTGLRLARILNTTVEELWGHLIEEE